MKLADPTLLKDKCLIDGKWVGEGVDAIHNPATGEPIAEVPRFGEKDGGASIEAAARALPRLGQAHRRSSAPRSFADGSS